MKVKLTQNCYVDGKPCKKGKIVETKQGALLIGCGKAEKVDAKKTGTKPAPANRQAEPDETR